METAKQDNGGFRIVELSVRDVRRVHAVEIRPDGEAVILAGDNAQGKSSVLNAIIWGLGGPRYFDEKPIRQGAKNATIKMDLGPFSVERVITEKGQRLTVYDRDGKPIPSPQTFLDKLTGDLAFDPLAFVTMKPGDQLALLKKLVGLDFAPLDQERKRLYDERTAVNRDGAAAKANRDAIPEDKDAPKEEQSAASLMAELERRQAHNQENKRKRDAADSARNAVTEQFRRVEDLRRQLAEAEAELKSRETAMHSAASVASALRDEDEQEIRAQLATLDSNNARFRKQQERAKHDATCRQLAKQSNTLTAKIEFIDAEKDRMMTEARFPVEGLSFDESGVLFNGLPFSQASTAEQLRVALAIGIALNPQIRVVIMRQGAFLDRSNLETVVAMARENNCQVWIERVGEGDAGALIIEDGGIRGAGA